MGLATARHWAQEAFLESVLLVELAILRWVVRRMAQLPGGGMLTGTPLGLAASVD